MTDAGRRVVAVVQARMSSSRLPGKVLRPLDDRPVLDWVVAAAHAANEVDDVVVAASVEESDDAIEAWGRRAGVRVLRGNLDDVLSRFVFVAREVGAEAVVRLTADCPLLDPALIDEVVARWRAEPDLDYVATTLDRTLPRGLDVELVRTGVLEGLLGTAHGHDRVHVTSAVYAPGSDYRRAAVTVDGDWSAFRVTLDEEDDARALDALVAVLPTRPPSWRDVVDALAAHPEIVALNDGVRQKELREG